MNLQEFASQCADIIEHEFNDIECVEVTRVVKNNGVVKTALSITKTNDNLSPTIYVDDYFRMYESGAEFADIMSHILAVYKNSLDAVEPDLEFFGSFEAIKDKLMCKLINKEKNAELLASAPHVECLDLAIVFYVVLELSEGNRGTVIIRNSHISNWNTDLGSIYEVALRNTKEKMGTCIWNIEEVLFDMIESSGGDYKKKEELREMIECDMAHIKQSPMYVMSNKSKCLGAACMLDEETLKKFSERINSSFYIIPSSIHELILIPDDNDPTLPDNLLEMVIEVNATQLSEDEFLADRVYKFQRELGKVTFA